MKKLVLVSALFSVAGVASATELCKDWSDKYTASLMTLEVKAEGCLYARDVNGAVNLGADASANLDSKVFNQNLSVARATAVAEAPEFGAPFASVKVFVFNNEVFGYHKEVESIAFEKEFPFMNLKKSFETIVTVGAIPLKLNATVVANGDVNISGEVNVRSASISLKPNISSNVLTSAKTALPIPGGVGVEANLELVRSSLTIFNVGHLSFKNADINQPILKGTSLGLHQTKGVKGDIYANAKFGNQSGEWKLFSFPGFEWSGELFNVTGEIPLN